MKKTLLFVLIVFMFSCKSSTEPYTEEESTVAATLESRSELLGWGDVYFLASSGNVSIDTLKKYIEDQRDKSKDEE